MSPGSRNTWNKTRYGENIKVIEATNNAAAWGLPKVLDYFATRRATTADVYPSEWLFLERHLAEGMSVLDIGCAQGGFAGILSEHLADFTYTGLDINAAMIARARQAHPAHEFLHIGEDDYSVLEERAFDLVLVLGILHLHETWRRTISAAWRHTGKCLIFDLRETHGATIEDKSKSYFKMDFNGADEADSNATLPYNIINSGEARAAVIELCPGAHSLGHFGYLHPVSAAAVTPLADIMANTYCLEKG